MPGYMTLSMKIEPKRKATIFDNCINLADIRAKAEMQALLDQEMHKAGGITPDDLRAINVFMEAVELPVGVVNLINGVRHEGK